MEGLVLFLLLFSKLHEHLFSFEVFVFHIFFVIRVIEYHWLSVDEYFLTEIWNNNGRLCLWLGSEMKMVTVVVFLLLEHMIQPLWKHNRDFGSIMANIGKSLVSLNQIWIAVCLGSGGRVLVLDKGSLCSVKAFIIFMCRLVVWSV